MKQLCKTEESIFANMLAKANKHRERHEAKERVKQIGLEAYLQDEDLGPLGCDNVEDPRMITAISLFRKATKNKISAQHAKHYEEDRSLIPQYYLNALKQYVQLSSLCSEQIATDISAERLRRILLMDACESIGDILLLQEHLNAGIYENAISLYYKLKEEAIGFLQWGRLNSVSQEDISEAEIVLFNARMSLATLHIGCKNLDAGCKETLDAMRMIRSRNNPRGVDYCEYIPFELRTASYATKRFSKSKRKNHEKAGFNNPLEEPLLKDSLQFEPRKSIVESIAERRAESYRAISRGLSYYQRRTDQKIRSGLLTEEQELDLILHSIATDPINDKGYWGLFLLERSPYAEDKELAKKAIEISKKVAFMKAETGNFEMVQVHSDYPFILTDGEAVYKREISEAAAKKHLNMLSFLREHCNLGFAWCELRRTEGGDYYTKMQLARNRSNGNPEQEFRAGSLEDMALLYHAEIRREPTPEELSAFRQKKLKQAIGAMIEFSSAGKDRNAFAKYGLDIPDLDYEKVLAEKVLPRIKLNADLKQKAAKVASELNKAKRAFCHGDPHPGNILDIGKEGLVIIDPVSACYASRFFDLAYLLEQAELDLNPKEKNELIDYFANKLKERGETIEEPQREYEYNALFVNLREAKVHSKKEGQFYNARLSKRHIQRAKDLLRKHNQ